MKDLFTQVKNQSLELRSLIRQGVKEGVEERIEARNQLLKEWFGQVNDLITLTNEQQVFLEGLLKEEEALLQKLKQEQRQLSSHQQGKKKLNSYHAVSKH